MQPLPAIVASETAQFATLLHGFHEKLACVPEELGSLEPRKKVLQKMKPGFLLTLVF